MHSDHKARSLFVAMIDFIGAALLAIFAIILGPLGVLRGPLVLESLFWHLWVLAPQALLSRACRAGVDWRLGNFDAAIVQLEFIVNRCELNLENKPKSRARRSVLEDYYAILVRAYLHGGHIDDAMLVVLRAKKLLRCERLPGMPRMDAKTAHLVRAGLAAGRLLDGGGLATLFVKSNPTPSDNTPSPNPNSRPQGPKLSPTRPPTKDSERQGASGRAPANMSNVIPFPKVIPHAPPPAPPPKPER